MACLSGGESRSWTVGELVERFKNLGVCATRASVTSALAELALELELVSWAPWRLLERGTEWILAPKSELLELLSGVRRLPLKVASDLSEEHKAVLLVIIGIATSTVPAVVIGAILFVVVGFGLWLAANATVARAIDQAAFSAMGKPVPGNVPEGLASRT